MNWQKSESNEKPLLVEKSGEKIIVRRNVKEEDRTDTDGKSYVVFAFEECVLTKEEHQLYLSEQQQLISEYLEMIAED